MNIILADHHSEPRWALKKLLEEQKKFDFILEAEDTTGLLLLAERYDAELILVDCDLPGIGIGELMIKTHGLRPCLVSIVMSSEIEKRDHLLQAGADDFISKVEPVDRLMDVLDKQIQRIMMKESLKGNIQA